jgi:hypothetical protein
MRTWLVVIAIVACVVAAAAYYHGTRPGAIVDARPLHPELIRFRTGSFRGIRLGECTRGVVRTLGRPVRWGTFPAPMHGPADAELPSGPANARSLDYADMAVAVRAGRVVWIVTTAPSAQTPLEVGVGDSLAIARLALPRLHCVAHSEPSDPASGPPACFERLRPGVNIEIIGDPITTIAVHGTRPRASV